MYEITKFVYIVTSSVFILQEVPMTTHRVLLHPVDIAGVQCATIL